MLQQTYRYERTNAKRRKAFTLIHYADATTAPRTADEKVFLLQHAIFLIKITANATINVGQHCNGEK